MDKGIDRLLAVMARLRDREHGCPWDIKQTYQSIIPFTVEEVYEVVDAVERGDLADLKEELGDLLFQVVFLARIAEEQGQFDFDVVASAVTEKLIRRHPHVFGDSAARTDAELQQQWEAQKARERQAKRGAQASAPESHLDGVAAALPSLLRALKLQSRAAKVGFDWPDIAGVLAKVEEELGEVRQELDAAGPAQRLEHEIGDLLFSVVNLARFAAVDPETALRGANRRFEQRFRAMEAQAQRGGLRLAELSAQELDLLWEQAKRSAANTP